MTDKVLQYKGIVPVPLFSTPWEYDVNTYNAVNQGLAFEAMSTAPQIVFQPRTLSTLDPDYKQVIGYVPNLDNPSVAVLDPTESLTNSNNSRMVWTDNCMSTFFNVDGTDTAFGEFFQPRISGDWSSQIQNRSRGTVRTAGLDAVLSPFACRDKAGIKSRGFICITNDGLTIPAVFLRNALGGTSLIRYPGFVFNNNVPPFQPSWENVFAGVESQWGQAITYDTSPFFTDTFLRTIVCNSDNAFRTSAPIPIHHPLLLTGQLDPIATQSWNIQTLSLQDSALDAFFQLDNSFQAQACPRAFLLILNTGGGGPTGQRFEYLYCNMDCTQYYLLQFVAANAEAALQLSRTTFEPSAKIDVDGTLWFNSGHPSDVNHILYSFALYGNPFPPFQDVSIPPFSLPCFNPCPVLP